MEVVVLWEKRAMSLPFRSAVNEFTIEKKISHKIVLKNVSNERIPKICFILIA